MLVLVLLQWGCRSPAGDRQASPAADGAARARPAASARPGHDREATLAALALRQQTINSRLGAHQLTIKSSLNSLVRGYPARKVIQQLSLQVDSGGGYRGTKNTSSQYGHEVIWSGGWLHTRLRFGKYARRRPRAGEPGRLVDRMAGHLPGQLALLRPFLTFGAPAQTTYQQRKAIKLPLLLHQNPSAHPLQAAPSRRWRRSIRVRAIKGQAVLDARTGVPLSVELSAAWEFSPPAGPTPASGIPARVDSGRTGTMELQLSLRRTRVGQVPRISPPPAARTIRDLRRRRLELERQMFSGESPIPAAPPGARSPGGPVPRPAGTASSKPKASGPRSKP